MKCRRLKQGARALDLWHRLWCAECRSACFVDEVITRGVARMRSEPIPPDRLGRTLSALGLRSPDAAPRSPISLRTRASLAPRRIALSLGLAVLAVWATLAFFGGTGRTALAETAEALRRVSSLHWTGIQVVKGQEQQWEFWYSAGGSREEIGDRVTVDDGEQQRSYQRGSRVVFVDRSYLKRDPERPTPFQPGGLIPALERFRGLPDWDVRVEQRDDKTPEGRRGQRFEIYLTHPGIEQKMVCLIDPGTKLPLSWASYTKRPGRWELDQRVDRIEYNVATPADLFQLRLPAGVRTIDVDQSKRARAHLAAQRTPKRREVILRAIDMTAKGDVMVSIGCLEAPDAQKPAAPVRIAWPEPQVELVDDHGMVYAFTSNNYIEPTYTMFWLVPLKPRKPGDPWPQRFTISVNFDAGRDVVTFRDIAAPPPAFEDVIEVPPYNGIWMDAREAEKIRTQTRKRDRARR
jgi:hypothetical protein